MSFRVVLIQVGKFIAVGLGFRVAEAFGGGIRGFSITGWVLAACALVPMVACFFGTARARTQERSTVRYPVREQFRSALSNRPFLLLAAYKFLTLLSGSTVFAILPFLVKNILLLDQTIMTWYSAAHGISALVSVPFIWV